MAIVTEKCLMDAHPALCRSSVQPKEGRYRATAIQPTRTRNGGQMLATLGKSSDECDDVGVEIAW